MQQQRSLIRWRERATTMWLAYEDSTRSNHPQPRLP